MKLLPVILLALSAIVNTNASDPRSKNFFARTKLLGCVVEIKEQTDRYGRTVLQVIKPDCFKCRWPTVQASEIEAHSGPASICYYPGLDCGTTHTK